MSNDLKKKVSLDDQNQSENKPVSIHKLEANRRNALKSTGPKTSRGKACSRRNAVKHGLFTRDMDEIRENGEDPREFQQYYRRLRNELQPVGPREEFEVEFIATCWLRLQRLWMYENAEVEAGKLSVARQVEDGFYQPLFMEPSRETLMSLLRTAEKEAEASGQISPELLKKIFAEKPRLSVMWPSLEAEAEKTAEKKRHDIAVRIAEERKIPLSEAKDLLERDPPSSPERKRFVAVETIRQAIAFLSRSWSNFSRMEVQNDNLCQLIPGAQDVDKIIRYGNAFERQMSRSYDRLERLQRLRK